MTVDLAKSEDFTLGAVTVQPALRTARQGAKSVILEPRVMQVLVLLAEHAGRPVDRDTMIERCWGGVIVGDDAIQRCIGRLRRLASELGGYSIETIPKIGYRLVHDAAPESEPDLPTDIALPSPPRLAFGEPSFRGDTAKGEEFATLLIGDIANALSINRDIAVLAPGVSGEADYRALIEVRENGERSLARCSVIEEPAGQIVWSDTIGIAESAMIKRGFPDEDLVYDIAGRIGAVIVGQATESSLEEPQALSAWQAVMRANASYQRIDLDTLSNAIKEARRAVALDPNYAAAHAALANALAAHFELGGARMKDEATEARRHCDIALALSPEDPTVLAWTAHALLMITRPAQGLALAEKSVELAPAHWIANLYLARHYLHHGRPADAERALDDHDRVAPLFPWKYFPILNRGLARYMQGDMEGAQDYLSQSAALNPQYPYSWISLMVLAALKQDEEAMRSAAQRLKQIAGNDDLKLQLARLAHSYPDPSQAAMIQNAFKMAWDA